MEEWSFFSSSKGSKFVRENNRYSRGILVVPNLYGFPENRIETTAPKAPPPRTLPRKTLVLALADVLRDCLYSLVFPARISLYYECRGIFHSAKPSADASRGRQVDYLKLHV